MTGYLLSDKGIGEERRNEKDEEKQALSDGISTSGGGDGGYLYAADGTLCPGGGDSGY